MFTWLQTKLQKHFRYVFIVLLVVLIIAFVFTIGNQGPFSGGNDRNDELRFFDTPINTQAASERFQLDAQLSQALQRNFQQDQNLPFLRATALHVANLNQIPEPNQEQLKSYIESLPAFAASDGSFNAETYNIMLDSIRLDGRFSESDLRRVIVDDYRIDIVTQSVAGPGFVREEDVLDVLKERNAVYSILSAEIDLGAFAPEVEITEEMLQRHYEEFQFTYQSPERRTVDYVAFKASERIGEVEVSEDELIDHFEQNLARYETAAAAERVGATPKGELGGDGQAEDEVAVTLEDVRSEVEAEVKAQLAGELALERAHDLIVEISDKEIARDSAELASLLASYGLTVETSAPFAASETPIGTQWGRAPVSAAFQLDESRFYSEPVQDGSDALVLFLNQTIAPSVPDFDFLRGRLIDDVREEEFRKLRAARAEELGKALAASSESEVAFGVKAESEGLEITPFDAFTLIEPPEELARQILAPLSQLEAGQVSDFIRLDQENRGTFLYVIGKEVPVVSSDDPQYSEIMASLTELYSRFTASQYLEDLMTDELNRLEALRN